MDPSTQLQNHYPSSYMKWLPFEFRVCFFFSPQSMLNPTKQLRKASCVSFAFPRKILFREQHCSMISCIALQYKFLLPKFNFVLYSFFKKYLSIWLCQVLLIASGSFSCSMQTLSYSTWGLVP